MKKRIKLAVLRFLKLSYIKLCRINDSPQKIAQGLGLGVFLGVMPGVGIIAALVMASLLRMNRASAALGALLTNTWSSFIIFIFSIKVGALVLNLKWQEVHQNWIMLLKDFHWASLLKISVLEVIFPIAVGYLIISLLFGIIAYILALIAITRIKNIRNKKMNKPAA